MEQQRLHVFNIERFALHDGPGIRTTIFLKGCPLHCPWCANPESQSMKPQILFRESKCVGCGRCSRHCKEKAICMIDPKAEIDREKCIGCGDCANACITGAMSLCGQKMTTSEIFQIVRKDKDYYQKTKGGITLSGGEALLQAEAIVPLVELCETEKIPVAIETCGYVSLNDLKKIIPKTELFLFDIKTLDSVKFKKYTGGNLKIVLDNFLYLIKVSREKVVIRIPVIPGFNYTEKEIKEIFKFAKQYQIKKIDLLPYHVLGIAKYQQLGKTYPFECQKGLDSKELEPFLEMGENMGLTLTIGG